MDRFARWFIPPLVVLVLALAFLVWDKRRSRGSAPAKTIASSHTTERPRLNRPLGALYCVEELSRGSRARDYTS